MGPDKSPWAEAHYRGHQCWSELGAVPSIELSPSEGQAPLIRRHERYQVRNSFMNITLRSASNRRLLNFQYINFLRRDELIEHTAGHGTEWGRWQKPNLVCKSQCSQLTVAQVSLVSTSRHEALLRLWLKIWWTDSDARLSFGCYLVAIKRLEHDIAL